MATANTNLATILSNQEEKILACVHCGLCLEACPTYVATSDENDGPRGRIYLMRAVKEGRLSVESPSFETHIDRCLGCRACEAACPAGVEYGHLLEAARGEILNVRSQRGRAYSLLKFALRHVWLQPKRLRAAFTLARLFRDSGLPRLLLKTTFPREMAPQVEFGLALLESSSDRSAISKGGRMSVNRSQAAVSSPIVSRKEDVFFFASCVTEGLFQRVNQATKRVLEVNDRAVHTPVDQVCCGALHAHAGDLDGARKLARRNIDAFKDADQEQGTPIITNAGGCGAMLCSYGHLLADDPEYADRAKQFSARVRDIGQQLQATGFRNGASIGFDLTTYDSSCHLLHGQQGADASLKMLWAIPDLNFAQLKDSEVCCGGAGVYNLMEPGLSQEVLSAKLECIRQSGAEVLVTGNPGCQMQIAAGARLNGMKLSVCHPVELLDESYRRAGFYE